MHAGLRGASEGGRGKNSRLHDGRAVSKKVVSSQKLYLSKYLDAATVVRRRLSMKKRCYDGQWPMLIGCGAGDQGCWEGE